MMNECNYSLKAMAIEVILAFQGEADRKGLKLEFIEEPGVPHMIRGDPNLRTVLSNIL
jgi:CheY-like chemotaxis protein